MKKSKLRKLIQIPLAFHHQDIHERLDEIIELIQKKIMSPRLSHNGRSSYSVPEPSPSPNTSPSIHDLVIKDIEDRKAFGLQKYGTALQAGNGRRGLVDAYQEALDLCCYLRQAIEEQNNG
jgi:hypothetical protein